MKKGTRAKRGKNKKVPSVRKAIEGLNSYELSNMTARAQGQLLASLNREANKRLNNIANALTKGNLRPTTISDSEVLQGRLVETKKGWEVGAHKRFTTKRNPKKAEMEEQIKQRIYFLRSPVSTVSGLKERVKLKDKQLIKLYNETFNLTGTEEERKRFTKQQLQDMGRLLNTLRDNHELVRGTGFTDMKYVKTMEMVGNMITQKTHKEIDAWIKDLESQIKNKGKEQADIKRQDEEMITKSFGK